MCRSGIVAEDADKSVSFHHTTPYGHGASMASSFSSVGETGSFTGIDPFDFSYYMDQVRVRIVLSVEPSLTSLGTAVQAPLTVQSNSPLELVQQLFTKLGARYIIITDTDGYCASLFPSLRLRQNAQSIL